MGLEYFEEEGEDRSEAAVRRKEHILPALEVREYKRKEGLLRSLQEKLGFCEDVQVRRMIREEVEVQVSAVVPEGMLKGFQREKR